MKMISGKIITSINGIDPSTLLHDFISTISQEKKGILERALRFEWESVPITVMCYSGMGMDSKHTITIY